MSYLVLARKFRPQSFQSIVGQEHIWRGLANAIIQGRVAHAFLLTGPRGVGKTTTARVFAKALNCQNRPEQEELLALPFDEAIARVEPCNECANCQEISRSGSLAVWEIDGASNNSVDNVRDLIDSLKALPPPNSRWKIYIVDEVHMLSIAAFNALLKSLEEPPPNTIFIFATTEPHKVPDTVLSRCQRHDFRRIPTSAIEEKLTEIVQNENVTVAPEAIRLIARKAAGGMRDAESMLDRVLGFSSEAVSVKTAEQILGFLDREVFRELNEAVLTRNVAECFAVVERIFESSIDIRSFFAEFVISWRNLLAVKIFMELDRSQGDSHLTQSLGLSADELRSNRLLVTSTSALDFQRLFEIASKAADQCLTSAYPRYILEAALVKMATLESLRPIADIVSALETATPLATTMRAGAVNAGAKGEGIARSEESHATAAGSKPIAVPTPNGSTPIRTNLDWAEFVAHMRGAGQKVLAEYLQRVTPREFRSAVFSVEGTAFYLSALQEPSILQALRQGLSSYSGIPQWRLDFQEAREPASIRNKAVATAGSLRMEEEKSREERERSMVEQATGSDAVKNALSTFSGSKVAGVSVLKE